MEQWKDIPGCEGRYAASNLGRIKSLTRRVRIVIHGVERTRIVQERVLRPGPMPSGHLSVAIGKGNSRLVHQLVMETFVGPRPLGLDTGHLDGDPTNNRLENLAYITRAENNRHALAHGRRRVSVEQVERCRAASSYAECVTLAEEMGVSISYTNNIRLGYSHAR